MNEQRWLLLGADDGWQIVIPETDIAPHGFPQKIENDAELAGIDCPCKPKIEVGEKMIIHNSFNDIKRVDEAMKSYV